MTQTSSIIQVNGPGPEYSFRVQLAVDKNTELVQNLFSLTPWDSFLLHVVVAGETFYMPTPSLAMASKNMLERRKGSVYYNVTGQSICFCYGIVTESTNVNQIGTVVEEDFPKLENLGRLVYEQTCCSRTPCIIKASLSFAESNGIVPMRNPQTTMESISSPFDGSWQMAKKVIDHEVLTLRNLEEPNDIQKIRLGATGARAGREPTAFQPIVILQGFLATLGPHVITRLLTISKYEDMTLPLIIRMTREFLIKTFNQFEFLGDCGLTRMHNVGELYNSGLDSVTTLGEYRELTDSMRSLIQLVFRWVHLIFPWFLKDQLEHHTPEEAASMPKLGIYRENMNGSAKHL